MNLADEIKKAFRQGNILYRLILINVAVFVVCGLAFVGYMLFTRGQSVETLRAVFDASVMKYLMLPSLPAELLRRPWTLVTYMFTHTSLFHILFNMLVLYWFGRIFLQYLKEKQFLSTYLLGGLTGAGLYILFFNLFPGLEQFLGRPMLGASAAIMAIVIAIAFYVPDYTLYMLFIGQVKLKYIALFFILIDVLMIGSDNGGGHIAHLGGALYGFFFIRRFKQGKDAGLWLSKLLDRAAALIKPRPRLNVTYRKGSRPADDLEYNRQKVQEQKEIDRILDKIAKGGYESLTRQEKETLFRMSDKKK